MAELNRRPAQGLSTGANSYLRVEKASLDPAGGRRHRRRAFRAPWCPETYHGLHSRYVVRSHGADIRLLVKEDGGAHPEPGTDSHGVRPA